MKPHTFTPKNDKILRIFVIVKPITKAKSAYLTSLIFLINVRAHIHTSSIATKVINPDPSLPSAPQRLLLISLENSVDIIIDTKIARIPPSRILFKNVTLPSHINFINSKTTMIVDNPRIKSDIPLSVQSQGKGIIANGVINRIKKKIYF